MRRFVVLCHICSNTDYEGGNLQSVCVLWCFVLVEDGCSTPHEEQKEEQKEGQKDCEDYNHDHNGDGLITDEDWMGEDGADKRCGLHTAMVDRDGAEKQKW